MNKKLQSMYKSGGLLKALLKDPAQAKMAMQMLGQAKAADGMAVNKTKLGMPGTAVPGAKNTYEDGGGVKRYRLGGTAMYANGGQNGPGGRRRRGKKEEPVRQTAKQAWQEAGYDREPVNWDRTTQSTREAVNPQFYEGFDPMMANTQNRGNVVGVNSFNANPTTAQQIAREVIGQQDDQLAQYGAGRYQAVIPSVEDIVQALQTTSRMDLTNANIGGQPQSAMDYIKSGMQDYAGPDFHTQDMVPGRSMFDAILSEAMGIAQNNFDTQMSKARGAQRTGENNVYRDVRDGETKEEFMERQDRLYYKPEMKEYQLLDKYGDRLYESSYFGDQGFEQAQGQAQADIRNAVIDMLNEAAGSNVYDQYRDQTNKFL
jgi:hypothetical protein